MIGLYRVAQEAIRNAIKHSGAEHVQVDLAVDGETVRLSVQDAGRGFVANAVEAGSGLGLVSMAERIASIGGQWAVRSETDGGTRIEASVPLAKTAEGVPAPTSLT